MRLRRLLLSWPFCHLVQRRKLAMHESVQQASDRNRASYVAWAKGHFGFGPWGLFGTIRAPVCKVHHRHMKVVANKGKGKNTNNKGKPQAMCANRGEVKEGVAMACGIQNMVFWDKLCELNPAIKPRPGPIDVSGDNAHGSEEGAVSAVAVVND